MTALYTPLRLIIGPTLPAPQLCRHCHKHRASRQRGLCVTCFYSPTIRAIYPIVSKYGRKGVGNGHIVAPLPDRPTSAPPGSEAKVLVLIERAAIGVQLWHPDDARHDPA